ncbi:MAG: OB-fold nucleic acid binding domain-containing protein [Candidatus Odinarchaeia archaeon]
MWQSRTPAKWKRISEINDSDTLIRVVGRVIERREDFLIIDDGSGSILVHNVDKNVEVGSIVRVIGDVYRGSNGTFTLSANIVHILKDVDLKFILDVYQLKDQYIQ